MSKSQVWLHFTKESQENAVCNLCSTSVKVKDGSTTNLHKHLKRHHSIELASSSSATTVLKQGSAKKIKTNEQQPTLSTLWTKLPTTSKRHQDISEAIGKYIAVDMRPLDSVNDRGFRHLISKLEPRYNLESRTYITSTLLPNMYNDLKVEVKEAVTSAVFVGLTTDAWTSRANKSFITVTAQLATKDWQLKEFVLTTREMIDSHTTDNLATDFENVLKEWGLIKSNITVTTDNAANISAAMSKCSIRNIKCMAHTLNLATQKALQVTAVSKVCAKIRKVVSFFRRSTVGGNVLRKSSEQLGLSASRPVIDVSTRWNSTLDMLERYLLLRPAIAVALTTPDMRSMCDNLSEADVELTESLVKVC